MPYPKLSPVLNNCPLHAITPELKNEIIKFKTIAPYDNGHNVDYELLKNKFATFYGFPPDTFTWSKFADVLEKYNEFDTQIIMGPVLREFMKDKMPGDEFVKMVAGANELPIEQHISNMTEINAHTARYESLSPDEVFGYVGKHLGFSIQYVKNDRGEISHAPNPIATIQMYHQGGIDGAKVGGHWERSNNTEEIVDVEQENDTQLTSLLPLLGNDNDINSHGFGLLKKHVQTTAKVTEENDLKHEFLILTTSAEQINFYIKALTVLPKDLAVPLLGDRLTEETANFVSEYIPTLQVREPIYEQWFRAEPEYKPHLNEEEELVIINLLNPPEYPEALQVAKHRVVEKDPKTEHLTEQEQQALEATISEQKKELPKEIFDNYKKEITELIKNRKTIMENAEINASKDESELTDEELAIKLQAREFTEAGFKP
ncbi:hypothetical protein Lgra_1350 [Legionella gratiana]|uniref:Uncharacterized protein n=1 Tax=Legionella gratiana TaxID=45066 RepID=A0A378JGN9_9GAMM|nr:hypothetical protein [Legionella gratiana]KTD11892.1 hypothetical protein Lgra_1350 [Legionella gratiana]STX46516.1 Uncharacterised protein [Legionella gratiana]